MECTKEYCVQMHRKMWNWIATKIEQMKNMSEFHGIKNLKKQFWKENDVARQLELPDPDLYMYCFCCLYACTKNNTDVYQNNIQEHKACRDCLMCWNGVKNNKKQQCCADHAEYIRLIELSKGNDLVQITEQCKKIMNLDINPKS